MAATAGAGVFLLIRSRAASEERARAEAGAARKASEERAKAELEECRRDAEQPQPRASPVRDGKESIEQYASRPDRLSEHNAGITGSSGKAQSSLEGGREPCAGP
jgi:hypothetical protein